MLQAEEVVFPAIKIARDLEGAGVGRGTAEAMVGALTESVGYVLVVVRDEMATMKVELKGQIMAEVHKELSSTKSVLREELAGFEKRMLASSSEFREGMQGQFTEFKEDMQGQFSDFKAEVRQDLADHKLEMQGQFAEFQKEMLGQFTDFKTEVRKDLADFKTEILKVMHRQFVLTISLTFTGVGLLLTAFAVLNRIFPPGG